LPGSVGRLRANDKGGQWKCESDYHYENGKYKDTFRHGESFPELSSNRLRKRIDDALEKGMPLSLKQLKETR
jgi:hypothetical protein